MHPLTFSAFPKTDALRPADPFGLARVIGQPAVLPQQAERLDPMLAMAEDELLIEVESLNIDSASFHQISEACAKDPAAIAIHIQNLVARRGKQHNPVTGSGGMLIGRVHWVGPKFPVSEKPVQVGDRIATLVSLTLTPLAIQKVNAVHPGIDRVDVEGHAVLFATGLFAVLPHDLPEKLCLAALDVAGAPAQTRKLVREGDTVVVIGGGGKSGLLCLAEAGRKKGVKRIALDYSSQSLDRVRALGLAETVVQADARNGIAVYEAVRNATGGRMADVVINVANLPETEMGSILSAQKHGIVYLFSMATSFTRAALGAEGVGADVDLRIGNGYTEGHAELTLQLLRDQPALRAFFEKTYA